MDTEQLPDEPNALPWHDGLTDKQRVFVLEYTTDWNATAAAIRAGYSEETARQIGSQNLSKLNIRAALDAYLDARSMTTGEAMSRLTDMGRATITPFIENYGSRFGLSLDSDEAKANMHLIREIGYNANGPYIKLHDSKDAIFKLMQMRGKIVVKNEHTGADGAPLPAVQVILTVPDSGRIGPAPGLDE